MDDCSLIKGFNALCFDYSNLISKYPLLFPDHRAKRIGEGCPKKREKPSGHFFCVSHPIEL
jgi:hypothetical protein